jgi:hypothetical protein
VAKAVAKNPQKFHVGGFWWFAESDKHSITFFEMVELKK